MLTDPRVSACLVLYHSGAQVINAVKCIQASTIPVELYIVDNSPAEPTARVIQTMCPQAMVLSQQKNLGFGRANNAVIPHLRSQYHLLINPDVTFEPDLIERMVAFMDEHKDVNVLTPRVFNPDGTEQFLPRRQPTVRYLLGGRLGKFNGRFRQWREEYTMQNERITAPVEVRYATGCFLLIRTPIFYQMHGFDERFFLYHEDSDLSRRVVEFYPKLVYHPDMHVTHAWHRDSSHRFKPLMQHVISTFKFFTKWGWRW